MKPPRVYIVDTSCHLTVRVGGSVHGHVACVLSKGVYFDEVKRQRIYAEIIRDAIKREAAGQPPRDGRD